MSAPVTTQLRDYFTYVEEEQKQVDVESLQSGEVRVLPSGEPGPARGLLYAAAAAVIVALLVGGVALLRQSERTVEPADQPTVTTGVEDDESQPTVTTVNPNRETAEVEDLSEAAAPGEWSQLEAVFDGPDASHGLLDVAVTPFGTFAAGLDALWRSDDERHWTRVATPFELEANSKILAGSELGILLAAHAQGVWFSPDGVEWNEVTAMSTVETFELAAVAASDRGFLVSAANLWHSPDGRRWTKVHDLGDAFNVDRAGEAGPGVDEADAGPPIALQQDRVISITAIGSRFYAAEQFRILFSDDGVTWTEVLRRESVADTYFTTIAASTLGLIATTVDGTVWFSPDGQTWDGPTAQLGLEMVDGFVGSSAASAEGFLTVNIVGVDDPGYQLWFSGDGSAWVEVQPIRDPLPGRPWSIAASQLGFVAVGLDEPGVGGSLSQVESRVWTYVP